MNDLKKQEYVTPRVSSFLMEMEQGIAAGSARVLPPKFWWTGSGRMDNRSG
ncbi:hypothetical protein [Elizabethkingia ursingii]|jgi:hypothetical protein|uniref:hypothetical protein n=1 Tax=Elizabethkingia ursingii TaxID=1756150 RepID=UPI00138FAE3B|nr:hypothetical protein [Elizabethkingia ursingii]